MTIFNMKDRIRQLMELKQMTQQSFAEYIEMSPASLSSIFNGRTKPTLNIVEAIKKKFPDINIEWLMFGTGEMFTTNTSHNATLNSNESKSNSNINFDEQDIKKSSDIFSDTATHENNTLGGGSISSVRMTRPEIAQEEVKFIDKHQRKITEIRVYFDDLTFETFVPSK